MTPIVDLAARGAVAMVLVWTGAFALTFLALSARRGRGRLLEWPEPGRRPAGIRVRGSGPQLMTVRGDDTR